LYRTRERGTPYDGREAGAGQGREDEESREELFAIIEAWGVAKQIEGFFEDAEWRAAGLDDDDEKYAVLDRLRRARALLGGVYTLQRFRAWRSPDER
jgi:hypothetical protein